MSSAMQTLAPLPAEDQARADLYALLARLFFRPPDASLLRALAVSDELVGSDEEAPITVAWRRLQAAVAMIPQEAAREEFDALFIGVGAPPIQPYASYYLTGALMEKPLARLRGDLARFGLARVPGVGEPEDHIASLAEVMRFLIAGQPAALAEQKRFFQQHIQPWYERLAADLKNNENTNFYQPVAELMRAFFAVEIEAFEMSPMPTVTGGARDE